MRAVSLRRVAPAGLATCLGAVGFLVGLGGALVLAWHNGLGDGQLSAWAVLLLGPLAGLSLGAAAGLLAAVTLNLAAALCGGITLLFEDGGDGPADWPNADTIPLKERAAG